MPKSVDFFQEKKEWSKMKDQILGWYLVPYLSKVNKFKKTIVVVDGFAGAGKYQDGTDGSPLIICKKIDDLRAKGVSAIGIFVEQNAGCFRLLEKNIKEYTDKKIATILQDDFNAVTKFIVSIVKNSPIFFYLDPFGIKGLEFQDLELIFNKANQSSTELLINFSYRTFLRELDVHPDLVKRVMGGNYYLKILNTKYDDDPLQDAIIKENLILDRYKDEYRNKGFKFVGSCPIMFKDDKRPKYHLIFATNHFDGLELMNDRMHDVFKNYYSENRLFTCLPENYGSDREELDRQIINLIQSGNCINRGKVRESIIVRYFMRYKTGDINKRISELIKNGKIISETGKIRINDEVKLFVHEK